MLFTLGATVATPPALSVLEAAGTDAATLLDRHVSGDWGDLNDEDKAVNTAAVKDGERILSSYEVAPGRKVWIITEWDRSVTTLLLPSEY